MFGIGSHALHVEQVAAAATDVPLLTVIAATYPGVEVLTPARPQPVEPAQQGALRRRTQFLGVELVGPKRQLNDLLYEARLSGVNVALVSLQRADSAEAAAWRQQHDHRPPPPRAERRSPA